MSTRLIRPYAANRASQAKTAQDRSPTGAQQKMVAWLNPSCSVVPK